MIQLVPVFQVDAIWPHLKEGMEKACKRGGGQYAHDYLWTMCRRGDAMLVVIRDGEHIKGGVVCEVQNWTGRQVLYVHAACGSDMKSWLQALHGFGTTHFGVQSIIFQGRPGWKVTPGVKVVRHVFEVAVKPED